MTMIANMQKPTVNFLRETFSADFDRGIVFWRSRPESHFASSRQAEAVNAKFAGREAGCLNDKGRWTLALGIKKIPRSRVVFSLYHGIDFADLPPVVDHINGVVIDDRIANLRAATHRQNTFNRAASKSCLSGIKGVKQDPSGMWRASMKINGSDFHLGTFASKEEAAAAYHGAARIIQGDFMRLG